MTTRFARCASSILTTVVLLLAGSPAVAALTSFELRWTATDHPGTGGSPGSPFRTAIDPTAGASTIAAEPGDRLTLEVIMHIGSAGVSAYGVSVEFDRDLRDELDLVSVVELHHPWLPAIAPTLTVVESDSSTPGGVYGLDGFTLGLGPVDTSVVIARLVFEVNDPDFDRGDVAVGLFDPGIDGVFDNALASAFVSFLDASVVPTTRDLALTRFVHRATASNSTLFVTEIDHPMVNGDPRAVLLIDQVFNPGGVGATYNDHHVGVFYDDVRGRWNIANLDYAVMPVGAGFNVVVPKADGFAFVHEAKAPLTDGNETCFDYAPSYNAGFALLLVTPNVNGGNGADVFFDHPLALRHDAAPDRYCIVATDGAAIPAGADFNVYFTRSSGFRIWTDAESTSYHTVSTEVRDDPDDIYITALERVNDPTGSTTYPLNPYATGLWFDTANTVWKLFNQDFSPITVAWGDAFDLSMPHDVPWIPELEAVVASADPGFTAIADLDEPAVHDRIGGVAFTTLNHRASTRAAAAPPAGPIGLYTDPTSFDLKLLEQGLDPLAGMFMVDLWLPETSLRAIQHLTNDDNTAGNWAYVAHPYTEGRPEAFVFAQHHLNPGSHVGALHPHTLGVWYDGAAGDWAIFNQDLDPMDPGLAFNVYIADPDEDVVFTHVANAGNIDGHRTTIDHPQTNGRADLAFVLSQNWSPLGGGGAYNDHEVAMAYDVASERWQVVNTDGAAIQPGAAFNILVPEPGAGAMWVAGALVLRSLSVRRSRRCTAAG